MALRTVGFSIFSFPLGALLFAAITSTANIRDDRAADREAIRAHIGSIFQAFIKKDAAALRVTHAANWLGYLEGSRTMINESGQRQNKQVANSAELALRRGQDSVA